MIICPSSNNQLRSKNMKSPNHFFLLILFGLFGWSFIFSPQLACAHSRTISFSQWQTDTGGSWKIKAIVPVTEFMRIYGADNWGIEDAADYTYNHLIVDPKTCASRSELMPLSSDLIGDEFIFKWTVTCRAGELETLSVQIDLFFLWSPSHIHVATFVINDKKIEKIITPGNTKINITRLARGQQKTSSLAKAFAFASAGIHHLAAGQDHVLFILALCLLVFNFVSLIKVITAFTLAHALALTPVLLGWIDTASKSVEALIGLSIVIVAIEANIRLHDDGPSKINYTRNMRLVTALVIFMASFLAALQVIAVKPLALLGFGLMVFFTSFLPENRTGVSWIHAFGFGLVHGLGMAGVLSENPIGPDIALALAGFNIGIEAGQIVLAVMMLALLRILVNALSPWDDSAGKFFREKVKLSELPLYVLCSCLIMIGTYWFSLRSIKFGGI